MSVASDSAASVAQNERRHRVVSAALLEFLDHVFAIGAAVVVAPHRERRFAGRQARDQRLEDVARHIEEFFAAGVRALGDAVPDKDQPARVRPVAAGRGPFPRRASTRRRPQSRHFYSRSLPGVLSPCRVCVYLNRKYTSALCDCNFFGLLDNTALRFRQSPFLC